MVYNNLYEGNKYLNNVYVYKSKIHIIVKKIIKCHVITETVTICWKVLRKMIAITMYSYSKFY